jgi:hypothetical protein
VEAGKTGETAATRSDPATRPLLLTALRRLRLERSQA